MEPWLWKACRHAQAGAGRGREKLLVPFLSSLTNLTDSQLLYPTWPPDLTMDEAAQGSILSQAKFASCFVLGGQEWTISVRPLCTSQFWPITHPEGSHQPGAPSSSRKPSQNPFPGRRIKPPSLRFQSLRYALLLGQSVYMLLCSARG